MERAMGTQMDRHVGLLLAMTGREVRRLGHPRRRAVAIQLDCFVAALLAKTSRKAGRRPFNQRPLSAFGPRRSGGLGTTRPSFGRVFRRPLNQRLS